MDEYCIQQWVNFTHGLEMVHYDSPISRKNAAGDEVTCYGTQKKGVFDIKYRVYRGMGLATINPTLSVWMWDD